ncbi:MAG: hypothetical protein ABSH20_19005 [Tepidisphaeraceae bacterium]|jgi:tetratricopeptide (TPR) repeat protein
MFPRRFILLCCLIAAPPAPGWEFREIPEEWRLAIVRLADPDATVRKRAADELLAGGVRSAKALSVAAEDKTSEIGAAARGILRDMAIGITPETPAKLVELVREYRQGDEMGKRVAVKQLLQNSPDGYVLLAGLAETDRLTPLEEKQSLFADGARAAPSVAIRLIQDSRELDAWRVLGMASRIGDLDASMHCVVLRALASPKDGSFGRQEDELWRIQKQSDKPAKSEEDDGGSPLRTVVPLLSLSLSGQTELLDRELAEYANTAAERVVLAQRCNWPALAGRLAPASLTEQRPQDWAAAALAHRLARSDGQAAIVERLKKLGGTVAGAEPAAAQALLLAGRVDDALAVVGGPRMQAELLAQLGRYADALEMLADVDTPEPVRTQSLRVQAELHLGLPADKSLARLTRALVSRKDLFEMQAAVEMLLGGGRRAEALEIAAATVDQTRQWDERSLFQSLYGERSYDAAKFFRWLELDKAPSLKETLLRVDRVMSGGLGAAELDGIEDKLRKDTDDLAIVNTLVPTVCREIRLHGRRQQAKELLLKATRGRFSLNGIRAGVAEELMRLGDYAEAARLFESAARADPDPVLRYLWGVCVIRGGDEPRGRSICRTASLMTLGNARQRLDQASVLLGEGFEREAAGELEICERMAVVAPAEAVEGCALLAGILCRRHDYGEAEKAMARSLVLRFLGDEPKIQPIARELHRLLRCRVGAAIARNDKPAALAELDEVLRVFPDDAIILFDSLPAMMSGPGWAAEVRACVGRWVARREKLLGRFPGSAEMCVGLAMVILRSGGDGTRAEKLLDTAGQADPGNRMVQQAREYLRNPKPEAVWPEF